MAICGLTPPQINLFTFCCKDFSWSFLILVGKALKRYSSLRRSVILMACILPSQESSPLAQFFMSDSSFRYVGMKLVVYKCSIFAAQVFYGGVAPFEIKGPL